MSNDNDSANAKHSASPDESAEPTQVSGDALSRLMAEHTSPDEVEQPPAPGGYGCPPTEKQYKLGQSGNRKGRPKGRKNWKKLLVEVLGEKVRISEHGKTRQITKAEAIVKAAMRRAVQGDSKSAAGIISLAEKLGHIQDKSHIAQEYGIVIIPRRCETHEEWERLHGAAARGDKYFRADGTSKSAPVTRPFTIDVGDRLMQEGNLEEALATYRRALKICESQLEKDEGNEKAWARYCDIFERLGILANSFLLAYKFSWSLEVIDEAIACAKCAAPEKLVEPKFSPVPWLEATRFLALLFMERIDEGRQIYMRYSSLKVAILEESGASSEAYWLSVTLLPLFSFLRKKGLDHPIYAEIEAAAAVKKIKPHPRLADF